MLKKIASPPTPPLRIIVNWKRYLEEVSRKGAP